MRLRTLALLVALVPAGTLLAEDGDLFPTFPSGGIYYAGTTSHLLSLFGAVEAPDGAAVAFGHYIDKSGDTTTASGMHWRRVEPASAGYECNVPIPGASYGWINAATFDLSGRLVVAGLANLASHDDVVVARFLYPACDLDESFDGDGIRTFDFEPDADDAHAIGVATLVFFEGDPIPLPTEDIFVAGNVGPNDVGLARLNSGGSFDASFDGDGKAIFDAGSVERARSLAYGAGGKLLVLGHGDAWEDGNDDLFVLAVEPSTGEGVGSFGGANAPWARLPLDLGASGWDFASQLAVTDEGRIHPLGSSLSDSGWRAAVAALDATGALVGAFSGDGKVDFAAFGAGTTSTLAGAIAFQGDDKILLAGTGTAPGYTHGLYVSRRLKGGGLDTGFGSGGYARYELDVIASETDESTSVQGMALLDGRILVVGRAQDTGINREFLVLLDNSLIFADDFDSGYTSAW